VVEQLSQLRHAVLRAVNLIVLREVARHKLRVRVQRLPVTTLFRLLKDPLDLLLHD
jgi:hypothetical protein